MLKLAVALNLSLVCFAASPIIDNERARIWDIQGPAAVQIPQFDFITVYVTGGPVKAGDRGIVRKSGDAIFQHKGSPADVPDENKTRYILIELKGHKLPPIANPSGLPLAFPRPGAKKVLDTPDFTIWDYRWLEGKPTPMHFHDKDAIVTYLDTGSIKSTTQDGKSTVTDYTPGVVKYNLRERIHTEELSSGHVRAIIVELK